MHDQVKELLQEAAEILRRAGIDSPRLDAEVLLADLLECERIRLYTHFDEGISPLLRQEYQERIHRRSRREPVAYIIGFAPFFHHSFRVTPHVLIPRPETEELVEYALAQQIPHGGSVLDLGTGSGCIGLSLLCEREDLVLHLSDNSPEALQVAKENARLLCGENRLALSFHLSHLYSKLPDTLFHAILSNPPYIHPDERGGMMPDVVEYEPGNALFHEDPPALYKEILEGARKRLHKEGFLLVEFSPRWAPPLLEKAQSLFSEARILEDLSRKERFLFAKK